MVCGVHKYINSTLIGISNLIRVTGPEDVFAKIKRMVNLTK